MIFSCVSAKTPAGYVPFSTPRDTGTVEYSGYSAQVVPSSNRAPPAAPRPPPWCGGLVLHLRSIRIMNDAIRHILPGARCRHHRQHPDRNPGRVRRLTRRKATLINKHLSTASRSRRACVRTINLTEVGDKLADVIRDMTDGCIIGSVIDTEAWMRTDHLAPRPPSSSPACCPARSPNR